MNCGSAPPNPGVRQNGATSPPVPLSIRERGDSGRPPERVAQGYLEVITCDITIPDADHAIPSGFQQLCARRVIGLRVPPVVRVALELQDETFRQAIEVYDEAAHDVLPAKLQSENLAVP